MIDGKNFFNQPINNSLKKYDNIRKTVTGQGLYNLLFVRLYIFQKLL